MTSILKTKTRICKENGRFLKNQMTVLQGDFVFLHGFKKTIFSNLRCNIRFRNVKLYKSKSLFYSVILIFD